MGGSDGDVEELPHRLARGCSPGPCRSPGRRPPTGSGSPSETKKTAAEPSGEEGGRGQEPGADAELPEDPAGPEQLDEGGQDEEAGVERRQERRPRVLVDEVPAEDGAELEIDEVADDAAAPSSPARSSRYRSRRTRPKPFEETDLAHVLDTGPGVLRGAALDGGGRPRRASGRGAPGRSGGGSPSRSSAPAAWPAASPRSRRAGRRSRRSRRASWPGAGWRTSFTRDPELGDRSWR